LPPVDVPLDFDFVDPQPAATSTTMSAPAIDAWRRAGKAMARSSGGRLTFS
jgi:hypothetical protein